MIRKIIAERLNISEDSINESSDIVEDLGADSLSVVEISLIILVVGYINGSIESLVL